MTDSTENPVDTTQDPAAHSKGLDADDAQSPGERAEAVREFDDHTDDDGPSSLDDSEAEHDGDFRDDGKTLPTPEPSTEASNEPKTTSRTE